MRPRPPDSSLAVDLDEAADGARSTRPGGPRSPRDRDRNVRQVAEAQLGRGTEVVTCPQGQTVTVGEVPVAGRRHLRAGWPCLLPVDRGHGLRRPPGWPGSSGWFWSRRPGPDGKIDPTTLAAAALCEVDEIYAVGGAQAIFALARGTETIRPVDVIAGPGNAWVQAAKRDVFGEVGDRLAGRAFGPDGGSRRADRTCAGRHSTSARRPSTGRRARWSRSRPSRSDRRGSKSRSDAAGRGAADASRTAGWP